MIIYIDSEYKCYTTKEDSTWREFDVLYFNGKAKDFIEGYRYIPNDESWEDESGNIFEGESVFPWVDYDKLVVIQAEYELEQTQDIQSKLDEAYQGLEIVGVSITQTDVNEVIQ